MVRILWLGIAVVALAPGQVLTEMSAAAAGGAIGGAAAKPINQGITSVLGKVDQLTKEAAADRDKGKNGTQDKGKNAPTLQVGPGQEVGAVPRGYSVPEPPPSACSVGEP